MKEKKDRFRLAWSRNPKPPPPTMLDAMDLQGNLKHTKQQPPCSSQYAVPCRYLPTGLDVSLSPIDFLLKDILTRRNPYRDGSSMNGALIGIEPLRLYGAQSAPKFRAWGRLAYLWDAAKIRNGGKRIYATVPEVLRNADGYLVNAKGRSDFNRRFASH